MNQIRLPSRKPRSAAWVNLMSWFLFTVSVVYAVQYLWGPRAWHQTTIQLILSDEGLHREYLGALLALSALLIIFRWSRALGLFLGFVAFAASAFGVGLQLVFNNRYGYLHVGVLHGQAPTLCVGTAAIGTFYFFAARRVLINDDPLPPLDGLLA